MNPQREDRPGLSLRRQEDDPRSAAAPDGAADAASENSLDREHSFTCPICGDRVDGRDLGARMLHARPAHRSRRVDRALERRMALRISGQG